MYIETQQSQRCDDKDDEDVIQLVDEQIDFIDDAITSIINVMHQFNPTQFQQQFTVKYQDEIKVLWKVNYEMVVKMNKDNSIDQLNKERWRIWGYYDLLSDNNNNNNNNNIVGDDNDDNEDFDIDVDNDDAKTTNCEGVIHYQKRTTITEKQIKDIYEKIYKKNSKQAPIILFADNNLEKYDDKDLVTQLLAKYKGLISTGIVTEWTYTTDTNFNKTLIKEKINTQFDKLYEQITQGRHIIIPAAILQDLDKNVVDYLSMDNAENFTKNKYKQLPYTEFIQRCKLKHHLKFTGISLFRQLNNFVQQKIDQLARSFQTVYDDNYNGDDDLLLYTNAMTTVISGWYNNPTTLNSSNTCTQNTTNTEYASDTPNTSNTKNISTASNTSNTINTTSTLKRSNTASTFSTINTSNTTKSGSILNSSNESIDIDACNRHFPLPAHPETVTLNQSITTTKGLSQSNGFPSDDDEDNDNNIIVDNDHNDDDVDDYHNYSIQTVDCYRCDLCDKYTPIPQYFNNDQKCSGCKKQIANLSAIKMTQNEINNKNNHNNNNTNNNKNNNNNNQNDNNTNVYHKKKKKKNKKTKLKNHKKQKNLKKSQKY